MCYSLLYGLEDDGFLDPLNDTDLFCVHFAILPQVNRCLAEFTDSWNNHTLSSAGNMTPDAIGLLEKHPGIHDQQPTDGDLVYQHIAQWLMSLIHHVCVQLCSKPYLTRQILVLGIRGNDGFGGP